MTMQNKNVVEEQEIPSKPAESPVCQEQLAYAGILDVAMKISLTIMALTFIIYVAQIRLPYISFEKLSACWSLSAHQFSQENQTPHGWLWIYKLGAGDYMNYLGMVLLAGVSALCYVRMLPIFLRKKDWVYLLLSVAEIVIIVLAASGIFSFGGH